MILAVQPLFLTRPLVSGILFYISDLSVSYLVFKANLLVSILFTLATNILYTVFLKKHPFVLHHLLYLNQQEQTLIYRYLIYILPFWN